MPLAYIHELTGRGGGEIDNTLPGGRPPVVGGGPIVPPPLPGVWPPPGHPNLPIDIGWGNRPPGVDEGWGQGRPLPPPGIYPPLQPGTVPPNTMVAILVKVVGSDTVHWIVVDTSVHPGTPLPPAPAPK